MRRPLSVVLAVVVLVLVASFLLLRSGHSRVDALCRNTQAGHLVQVIHTVPVGSADDGARDDIERAVADADHYLAASGPGHRVRWACDAEGLNIAPVTSPAVGDDGRVGFAELVAAAQNQGHNRGDRLYAIFYRPDQGYGEVGESTGSGDGSVGPQYALTVEWTGFWVLHELGHALGAVPGPAPHQYAKGHCFEQNDIMCRRVQDLDDPAYAQVVEYNCPDSPDWLFDCNHDDYYLHDREWWDVADSPYLYLSSKYRPAPAPRPSPLKASSTPTR